MTEERVEELEELVRESPPWSKVVVGIKFQNREMIVLDAEALLHWLKHDKEGWGPNYYTGDHVGWTDKIFHGARLTPKNNISMVKPELDNWASSRSGLPDWRKFCREIGLEKYDFE